MILGEGAVAEVGAIEINEKGQRKRVVTIALLGGGSREPQIIRAKLVDDLVGIADGLEPYTRVRFIGTYRLYNIDGKSFPVMTVTELERVGASIARPEVAA